MGRTAPVGFRVNPDVGAGGHAKITTGSAENKFGIAIGDALDAYARAAALPGLPIQGVAVHIGSQLTSLDPLERAFSRVGELIGELRAAGHDDHASPTSAAGSACPTIPICRRRRARPNMARWSGAITGGWDARLVFEPGRLIVGNAGVLLSRVIRVKPGATDPFVIVDAAMNDLMRPALYDAWHRIEAVRPPARSAIANVVGPVCETGDTFATGARDGRGRRRRPRRLPHRRRLCRGHVEHLQIAAADPRGAGRRQPLGGGPPAHRRRRADRRRPRARLARRLRRAAASS